MNAVMAQLSAAGIAADGDAQGPIPPPQVRDGGLS
jgi:hypothetical protein